MVSKQTIEHFSNKILMIFKQGLEITDIDMMNQIRIEEILKEFSQNIQSDPKAKSKQSQQNLVWVINFDSIAMSTSNFQYWQRGERKEIIDYELSLNPSIPEEEWSKSIYNYQAVIKANTEKDAKKLILKDSPHAKITATEQIDIYQLKSLPMFSNLKID